MAKVKNPLYSVAAKGTFGGAITYQRSGSSFRAQRPPGTPQAKTPERRQVQAYFKWAITLARAVVSNGVGFEEGPPELRRPWEDSWYEHWSSGTAYVISRDNHAVKVPFPFPDPNWRALFDPFALGIKFKRGPDWFSWLCSQLLNRAVRTSGLRFVDFLNLPDDLAPAWREACPDVLVPAFSHSAPNRHDADVVAFNTFFISRQVASVFTRGIISPAPAIPFPLFAYGRSAIPKVSRYEREVELLNDRPYWRYPPVVDRG